MGIAPSAAMKRLFWGMAAALVAMAAQAEHSGTYMVFDIGANYVSDIHQTFPGPPPTEQDRTMDLGIRASVAEGFILNRFLRWKPRLYNELDNSDDWLVQIPLLVNLV